MNEEDLPMGPEAVEALRKALTEAYERGVAHGEARERARCKRIVIYEGHNHGVGDDGPKDRAQSMSDSIVKAIDDGRPASDWL